MQFPLISRTGPYWLITWCDSEITQSEGFGSYYDAMSSAQHEEIGDYVTVQISHATDRITVIEQRAAHNELALCVIAKHRCDAESMMAEILYNFGEQQ